MLQFKYFKKLIKKERTKLNIFKKSFFKNIYFLIELFKKEIFFVPLFEKNYDCLFYIK